MVESRKKNMNPFTQDNNASSTFSRPPRRGIFLSTPSIITTVLFPFHPGTLFVAPVRLRFRFIHKKVQRGIDHAHLSVHFFVKEGISHEPALTETLGQE